MSRLINCYVECRYDECHYAECLGALKLQVINFKSECSALERRARYLTGMNLEVVRAKFSTLSWAILTK